MSDELILHHYAGSPFSEKVRLVLGFKGLAWRSVIVPAIMPKPDVVALTGGYRRTPFLQIGADIYCDSALMCRVIEARAPAPSLYPVYPAEAGGAAEILARWADTELFWTAIPYTMQPAGAAAIFAGLPPEALQAFGADRAAMTAGMRRANTRDATAALQTQLGWLERQLQDGRAFLCGAAASIADFSAAQSIWYIRRAPPVAGILAPFERVAAWFERVAAFGHGASAKLSSSDAITLARDATPAPVASPVEAGQPVTVAATDYATDPVAGVLVGLSHERITLRREDERAGIVHVHFPRIGYSLKKQETTTS